MAKLIYSTLASLDGYIADEDGNFDWAAPSEEVHAFLNELERSVGTYLLGRRTYEVLTAWETMDTRDEPKVMQDFAELWLAADKIVYSRTLQAVSTAKTRLEPEFDPEVVRSMKASAARDMAVGGAELAGQAIKAGLVDEWHLFRAPVLIGGGTASLPEGVRLDLELLDERRFGDGMVYLRYRTKA